eukprot:COSAG02_NODE_33177_length_504_cov_0.864198_1_plen_20_part_01
MRVLSRLVATLATDQQAGSH